MGDLFHEAVEVGFICRVLAVVALSPRHTFIVLTKRPKGALDILTWISGKPADLLSDAAGADWSEDAECQVANAINGVLGAGHNVGWPMRNLWLGVSCENQNAAEDRIPILLRTPAALRFVSVEPMLGPVDPFLPARAAGLRPPHWVICGGETGPGARPMDPHWARTLRDQCRDADVPFFFKRHNGRKIEGDRLLDGELWHQFPADRRS
jgi:protein gp37